MRAQIGVAMQDSVLLSGSVRENIALERSGIDDAEMLRASQLSGTHGFMGQLANGYDLKLADRGDGLSGGQRQSIALDRKSVGEGKSVSVRVELGGRRILKKKKSNKLTKHTE